MKSSWSTPGLSTVSAAATAQSGGDERANEGQITKVFPNWGQQFAPSGPLVD